MYHVESAEQAVARLEDSAERHERTVRKALGDPDKRRRADYHHLRTVRNTRRQVRYNGAIPHLERSILGTTGSVETLEWFQKLAKDIGEKAGQPLVDVDEVAPDGGLRRAMVGELTGGVHVWDGFSAGAGVLQGMVRRAQLSAKVLVGAESLVCVERGDEGWNVTGFASPREKPFIPVAVIELDEWAATGDPEDDFEVRNARFGDETPLLLGADAIRASELFEPDLRIALALTGTEL